MARINFITSFRSRMMKTPICISLANEKIAPIIDIDFEGNNWTRLSKIISTVLEFSDPRKLPLEKTDFIRLRFHEVPFTPIWVGILDTEEDSASNSLSNFIQGIYSVTQRQFSVNYTEMSLLFQGKKFEFKEDPRAATNYFRQIFVDCPGAGIRFDREAFVEEVVKIKENIADIEIFLYHVVDYNLIINMIEEIPEKKMSINRKLQTLVDAFDRAVGYELRDVYPVIDGIALIVNFFEFKKKIFNKMFRRIRMRSAYENLRLISSSNSQWNLYITVMGSKLREVYFLDECSNISNIPDVNKYENAYNFLMESKNLEHFERVGLIRDDRSGIW